MSRDGSRVDDAIVISLTNRERECGPNNWRSVGLLFKRCCRLVRTRTYVCREAEREREGELIKKTFLLASIYFITCLECLIDVINGILLENLAEETARRQRMQ